MDEAKEKKARKEAETRLKESEYRFSLIFHSSPVGIVMTRMPDGMIMDVNSAFAMLHGYTCEEIIGHTSTELVLWEDTEEREGMLKQIHVQGRCKDLEIKARKKNGEIRNLQISAELIEMGGEQFMLGLAFDITDRKHIEKELKVKMNELQRFQNLTVGRELKMIELKKEVNELLKKSGLEEKYKIVE